MFRRKIYMVMFAAGFANMTLNAMDMDKVNALAAQFMGKTAVSTAPVNEPKSQETKASAVTTEVKSVETPKVVVTQPVVEEQPKVEAAEPAAKPVVASISEESLGLRKVDLYSEGSVTPEATSYGKSAAGTSQRFERAFENAPPMIPHDVEGMLPIKVGNNACTGCHMPEVAASMKATPIPPSHFASFRPVTKIGDNGEVIKEGKTVSNTSDIKTVLHKLDKLSTARFNCSQCHAPQSTQAPLVGNTFKPEFTTENGSKRSNLIDTINEGVQ